MVTGLPPCDCLDRCGDDPRLPKRLVRPCADKLHRDRHQADIFDRMHLQTEIAVEAALHCIQAGTPRELIDGLEHYRIDDPSRMTRPPADVARAARYLLLTHHAIAPRPGLLRLVTPQAHGPRQHQRST